MLTLIVSRGRCGKIVFNKSLYLGSFFSNMVFQDESSKSIINPNAPNLPMPKIYNLHRIFLSIHRINTKNLTNNLLLIYKGDNNITITRRNPSKDVETKSSICNNNGKFMNPKYMEPLTTPLDTTLITPTLVSKCSSLAKSLQSCKIKKILKNKNTKKPKSKLLTFSSTYLCLFIGSLLLIQSLFIK